MVVAQVKDAEPHPNADKLSVTQIDAGQGALLQVVCGAKNYKVGDKVPLATVGTKLPERDEDRQGRAARRRELGMLCSARELGLSEDARRPAHPRPEREGRAADRRRRSGSTT